MIFRLLGQIAKARPATFPEIAVGTASAATGPRITLRPGDLTAGQTVRDPIGDARAQAIQQDFKPVKNSATYKLDKTPLDGSVSCLAIFDQGKPSERSVILVETDDYTVDPAAPAINLTTAGIAKSKTASILRVSASFIGIQGSQEFSQLFQAEVVAAALGDVEQWSALFLGLVLTGHDGFIQDFNANAAPYQSGDYLSRPVLHGFKFLQTVNGFTANAASSVLTFEVRGRIELVLAKPPSFSLIQQVVSPGKLTSTQDVDIEVKIG